MYNKSVMDKTNITIIGAGVCGLATSYLVSKEQKDILVVEKNDAFGRETSSRNSEVIHAGIYYPPDSLKAETCIRGKALLYQLCKENNITHKQLGKILVAIDDEEFEKIKEIKNNAEKNGIKNLRFLDNGELKSLEPNINAKEALLCPDTGIIDSHQLMKFFQDESKKKNVEFAYNIEVVEIKQEESGYTVTVKEPEGELFSFQTKYIINAAGFDSDKVAQMVGIDIKKNNYKIHYSKGQYFRISNPKKFVINHLIYPPPSKTDLGIHITPDLAGGLRLGPDAHYVAEVDYQINEKDKGTFQKSVSRFLKNLKEENLTPDTVGIRAKLQAPGEDFRDFVINEESDKGLKGFINILGIESPGLTACLAIAEKVKKLL
ncbi:MAG: NAD(P)/FAD-dependent oxidoreductase [Candidatus Aceula meridiana]|nr:NAD(P)/FAD-dependent oxidoreductase [Candidatus Aceula meridiana]